MQIITRKPEVKSQVEKCIAVYQDKGVNAAVKAIHDQLLTKKIKFPLLEYAAHLLSEAVAENDQISFCSGIEQLKTIGGNVIIGILLQNRLEQHFDESLAMAAEYISKADAWYVCDIIGERVWGYSLLHEPQKTFPEIKKMSRHPSRWVVRSLGAGVHYAIKKGLEKSFVKKVFPVLLAMANTKDKEIKQGVGWAAKTTAKFHPDVIEAYHEEIQDEKKVAGWFRTKVKIGLGRHDYAKRN